MARTKKLPDWKLLLLSDIRKHAINEYENGWDVIVECFTDSDILAVVGSAYTLPSWIKRLTEVIAERNEAIGNCQFEAADYEGDVSWLSNDYLKPSPASDDCPNEDQPLTGQMFGGATLKIG